MKSEKGVTLMSLIVYVVAMVIVIAIITVITTYFYNNINIIGENVDPSKEYTRFNSYFSEEVNKKNNKILAYKAQTENGGESYIIFGDGTQYTFTNNSIYKNKVRISQNITNLSFEYGINNRKEVVKVKYELPGTPQKESTFTLI